MLNHRLREKRGFAMYFVNSIFRAGLMALTLMAGSMGGAVSAAEPVVPGLEIVVFEINDCAYCDVFRNRVARAYQKSDYATRAPLRIVGLESQGTDGYPLKSKITTAPTIIIFYQGREVERISGLPSRAVFLDVVARLIEIYG